MAKQLATFISGKIGNVVFYKRGDLYFARSVPGKVKQTDNTKKRSTNFGVASRAGKALRSLLLPVLPFPKDKIMQGRFSGAISKWLQTNNAAAVQPVDDVPFLQNFNFNEATSFGERCRVPLVVAHP